MKTLNIIMPALNEEIGIVKTINSIPLIELWKLGYNTKITVVDNGCTDKTIEFARELEATIIREPNKGYGNAYKTGFMLANSDYIVTADADGTYPMKAIPILLKELEENDLDFITTNRISYNGTMPTVNRFGNFALSLIMRTLYGINIKDSQSGMWIFKRELLNKMMLKSNGMAFSEELKIEACYYLKCKWNEYSIQYGDRIGKSKLGGKFLGKYETGARNLAFLFQKRFTR